jgi:hypothetical protein
MYGLAYTRDSDLWILPNFGFDCGKDDDQGQARGTLMEMWQPLQQDQERYGE